MNKFKILDELQHYKKIVAELEKELQEIEEKDSASSNVQPVKKKLVIKFWKAEKALVMQILEQEGLPGLKEDGTIKIIVDPAMHKCKLYLRGKLRAGDFKIDRMYFGANSERDKYLDKITNTITDELFSNVTAELKMGEMCEVSDFEHEEWETRKLLAILPPHIEMPFVVERKNNNAWVEEWRYARPISKRIEPKVETNGEIVTYTWEEEE